MRNTSPTSLIINSADKPNFSAHFVVKRLLVSLYAKLAVLALLFSPASFASSNPSLPELVKQIKPSIVGIALFTPLEANAPKLRGSGFVVGNGKYVVTNYHVVAKDLAPNIVQHYVALSGEGRTPKAHKMEIIDIDPVHDLAILSIADTLPALKLAGDNYVDSGTGIAMTGFPLGAILGLYPATHTGVVATLAPDINPASNADELTVQMLKRLKEPFMIYQLDITAFPGNSGSPIYNKANGEVIAVLNKVFVSQGKEAALSNPSGISYAIPIKHLRDLAIKNNIKL